MINRLVESKIAYFAKNYKAVVLVGPRKCGKNAIVQKLFPKNNLLPIDNPFLTVKQKIEQIKFACENRTENGLILIVNSLELDLISELKKLEEENLIKMIFIQNLSYRESSGDNFNEHFIPTIDFVKNHEKSAKEPDIFWSIIYKGASLFVNEKNDKENIQNEIKEFYESFLKDFIFQDVMKITAIKDCFSFRAFFESLAKQSGVMLNYSKIAHEIKKDVMTVKHWVQILIKAKIIFLVNPYNGKNFSRAIKSTPKVYFYDTGLACYLCKCFSPQELAFRDINSQMFENFAVSEIAKSFINNQIEFENNFFYYRAKDKKSILKNNKKIIIEDTIDLIIDYENVLYPIKITQNFSSIKDISNVFEILEGVADKKRGSGAIICNSFQAEEIANNIFQIPIWFL